VIDRLLQWFLLIVKSFGSMISVPVKTIGRLGRPETHLGHEIGADFYLPESGELIQVSLNLAQGATRERETRAGRRAAKTGLDARFDSDRRQRGADHGRWADDRGALAGRVVGGTIGVVASALIAVELPAMPHLLGVS
jgi:hypothetical protein